MTTHASRNPKTASDNNNKPGDIWHCLSQVKVLDLTNELGFMCGKILADLGADVIKVEPPGESSEYATVPFYRGKPEPLKSLYWFSFNAGKRGITLNLAHDEGTNLFKKLTAKVDIVIESFPPGKMKAWGLDYEDISIINPRLIYTSITAFGRDGPYRDYKTTDLVAMAMGGPLFLTGDDDRPPVQIGYPQAYLHAGAEASVATLMALYEAEISGEGQLVDISVQESLIEATFNTVYTWITEHTIIPRMGSSRMVGKQLEMPLAWPCKDGYVNFSVLGGPSGGRTMRNLSDWMEEEGMGDKTISGTDWASFDFYGLNTEMVDKVSRPLKQFFSRHTRQELFSESIKRGIMLFPVTDADDILNDSNLEQKGFWQELEHPEYKNKIAFPRGPFRINDEYTHLSRPAPFKGEHNSQVYRELLGLAQTDLDELKSRGII